MDSFIPAIDYLESRITGTCDAQYSCKEMHDVCDLIRVFDPLGAHLRLYNADAVIDELPRIPVLAGAVDLRKLKAEAPHYLATAARIRVSVSELQSDVASYTEFVLRWWQSHCNSFPEWGKAARIVFSMSPNSASCERVFSLLQVMFGESRSAALADMLQASLMLRYNKRKVG